MPQLAEKVRAKYPGQYGDMDDAQLEAAVLAKYPEYQDLVDEPGVVTPEVSPSGRREGILGKLTQPLTTAPSRFAESIAGAIDEPALERGVWPARVRGFGAGAIQGIGDLISGLTSPLDLSLLATTGGATATARRGLTGATKALNVATRAGGGAVGLEGLQRAATAEDPGQFGQGMLEIAGGLAAGLGRLPRVTKELPTPRIKPSAKEVPTKIVSEAPTPVLPTEVVDAMTPQNKLLQVLEEAKPLNKEQLAIYRVERAKKAAKAKGVKIETEADARKFMAQLKGEHSKVSFEAIRSKLTQDDVDSLFKTVHTSQLTTFERARGIKALWKILDEGQVPQKSEIALLNKVFGDDFTATLTNKMPFVDKRKALLAEAVNLPRGIMASYDLSAPFRQGVGLIHKKEFWRSFDDMFRALGSEKGFRAVRESVEATPTYELAKESKLALTDLLSLSTREEAIMSTWAEKIPGVRASNRAYVGFLNKLRMDTFDNLVGNAKKAGFDPKTNRVLADEIASFVNTATGRGNLGRLEKHAVLLNSTFFSPRMIASRVRMLNPNYYVKASPMIRKEALKSLFAIAGFGGTIVSLGKAAGGEVSLDPRSSDFGKLKIGNTRLDPYGGFQQYIVGASRLITGQSTSPVTGRTIELGEEFGRPTRKDISQRLVESKLHPVASFVTTMLEGKDFTGQPASVSTEVARRFTPILLQDLYELAQEDPELIPFVIPPATFGMGSQTFQER